MNAVIVLSGGSGIRMKTGLGCPKQYYEVEGKPVISYCLETFQRNKAVDYILIVADKKWHEYIYEWIKKDKIYKFYGFATPGETRQLSIYNGLIAVKDLLIEQDIVLIHDAARPLVSDRIIEKCFDIPINYDGVMPVLPVADTMYQSKEGKEILQLLPRNEIYLGQAPESFKYGKYMRAHENTRKEIVAQSKGSSELAYRNGMRIALIEGEQKNMKITTPEDMNIFRTYVSGI